MEGVVDLAGRSQPREIEVEVVGVENGWPLLPQPQENGVTERRRGTVDVDDICLLHASCDRLPACRDARQPELAQRAGREGVTPDALDLMAGRAVALDELTDGQRHAAACGGNFAR